MNRIIECRLDSTCKEIYTGIWQHDYGQILRITGADLPKAVEVQFSLEDNGGDTLTRIGTTADGATEVKVPDSFLKNENCTQNYLIYAWIYVTDDTSGNTEYQIILHVKSRPKPEEPTEEPLPEPNIFHETVEAVNAAADRAEQAEQNAKASATEAGKYAASASESATAAEKNKEDALKEVGEKKQKAIEAIQEQEETSVGKITIHTDDEIQRIQKQTVDSKARLEQTITNAGVSKEELDESIQTAGDTKTVLDKSTELAGTAKTELDASTQKAGEAKTALDGSAKTAGEMQETLSATVKQADALDTSLGEKIKTGTQLNEDITASGEKAVQDIQNAGSEQLGKMQAVAEEFTADREQIATNKEDIGSLKEDLSNKITKFYASNQGETHLADSDNGKIMDMMLYGKSSQEGTPTIENPIDVKSVVNPTINVLGKNIFKCQNFSCLGFRNYNPITLSNDYGTLINSTEPSNSVTVTQSKVGQESNPPSYLNGYFCIAFKPFILKKKCVFSFDIVPSKKLLQTTDLMALVNGDTAIRSVGSQDFQVGKRSRITFEIEAYNKEARFIEVRVCGISGVFENLQIEEGSSATAYEPYKEQNVTLPYTLNAIPISKGGNVTIDGQQYMADYIDVEKGKLYRKVKRIDLKNISGLTNLSYGTHANGIGYLAYSINNSSNETAIKDVPPICNNYIGSRWTNKSGYVYIPSARSVIIVDSRFTDKSTAMGLIQDTYIFYALVAPIEENLTAEQVQSLKALKTYYPTTNINIDSEQLEGYTVFNYPISMANGWNYVKKQLNDNRDYIYDMDTQSAEAYVNSEYAVALTELEI